LQNKLKNFTTKVTAMTAAWQ